MLTLDSNKLQALSLQTLHSESTEKNKDHLLYRKSLLPNFLGQSKAISPAKNIVGNDVFLYRSTNDCPFNSTEPAPASSRLTRFLHALLGPQQADNTSADSAEPLKALEPISSNDWQSLYPGWLV